MKITNLAWVALTLFALVPAALANNWYVDGVHGSNKNDCKSPRHACKTISNAMSLTRPGDSIFIAPATYRESIFITYDLKFVGSGAATTIIDAGGLNSQVFVVGSDNPATRVTLSGVSVQNGAGQADGGGIYNCSGTLTVTDSAIALNRITNGNGTFGYGGGVYNCPGSTLTIINTTIIRNSALIGGAICNGGVLTIRNSTIMANVARQSFGGAIANYGTMEITNSTFSGNSSGSSGLGGAILNGGIFNLAGALSINNSTLSGNTAGFGGGGIFNASGSAVIFQNSIVANNQGGNCLGTMTSTGYNLSSDDSCDFEGPGDLTNTDPLLGPLEFYGGLTRTMALLPGSPAIDAGNPNGCTDSQGHPLKTDQRGMPRPDKEDSGGCDMGAYERQQD
jgi:hypothetical protein